MINTSKLGILVYMHTLTAHIMYNLKYRLEPYLCKLSTSNIIYLLNLNAEAATCQFQRFINIRRHMISNVTRCTGGVRVVFSRARMRFSNSARMKKSNFTAEKIV